MDCNEIRAFITLILFVLIVAASSFGSQGRNASERRETRPPASVQSTPSDDGRHFF